MMKKAIYLFFLLISYSLCAQPFSLVKDINTSKWFLYDGGSVSRLAELGGHLYVTIYYPQYGEELWKIDKLTGNKEIVKDIYPGWMGTNRLEIFVYHNFLFFSANDGLSGEELWKSDGTAQGTTIVKDINQGFTGSFPHNYIIYKDTLFFVANGELWKSDGTGQGTSLVKDIYPGDNGSDPSNLCIKDGILYFAAEDSQNGIELWRSDGTADGTYMVKDIYPGLDNAGRPNSGAPSPIKIVNGYLVFSARDATHGREMWTSDGTTAGTTLLKDLIPGISYGTQMHSSELFKNRLYFSVVMNGSVELWSTNGQPQSTHLEKKLFQINLGWINNMVSFKGSLYLLTYGNTNGYNLWKSDGTSTGTVEFVQIGQPHLNFGMIADENFLYYIDGGRLMVIDGTSNPPRIVKNDPIGYGPGNPTEPETSLVNGRVYFQGKTAQNGIGMWKSDGSTEGTLPIIESKAGTSDAIPSLLTVMKNKIYFSANDSIHGPELWTSNGTDTGTYLMKDISAGYAGSYPQNLTAADTNIFFSVNGRLWKSNGTSEGTVQIQPPVCTGEAKMVLLNGLVYFLGSYDCRDRIWKSDGTDAGTVPAETIQPTAYTGVNEIVAFQETIFFSGYDVSRGMELWKIDKATSQGVLVKDINPGQGYSNLRGFVVAGNYLYFIAYTPDSGEELWRSDGTSQGTLVLEILPGPSGSYPVQLTAVGTELYFTASDSLHGIELWKSNGTVGGTVMVKDIHTGTASTSISNLTTLNGTLYFDAFDSETGIELWKSDGTSGGTVLFKETWTGPYGNGDGAAIPAFNKAAVINQNLILTRANGMNGQEPWFSNGTEAGTMMIQDVFAGTGSSIPSNYVVAGGKIFFIANMPGSGIELWAGDINAIYPSMQINFDGRLENKDAILNWETLHERLLDKFEVQRSTDGVNFSTIGETAPKGGLGISAQYSLTDSNVTQLNKPIINYRLRISDTAGAFSYSDTVNLEVPNPVTSPLVKVWPNPSSGNMNISIALVESDDLNFVLYDLQGRAVKKWNSHFESGITSSTLHLQVLNAGVYYLSVKGRTLDQLIKLIKM